MFLCLAIDEDNGIIDVQGENDFGAKLRQIPRKSPLNPRSWIQRALSFRVLLWESSPRGGSTCVPQLAKDSGDAEIDADDSG